MFLTMLFEEPVLYLTLVAIVIVSIVLHELGHAIAASWEGDPTPRIRGHLTWNPVVHMGWLGIGLLLLVGLSFGRTPVTPAMFRHRRWGEVIVSAAGPAVNLFLSVFAAFVYEGMLRAGAVGEDDWKTAGTAAFFWIRMLYLNLSLFFLNMIPLPPLDGFTVAEGSFNLGEIGQFLRRAVPYTLIVAFFIVQSDAFDAVIGTSAFTIVRLVSIPFALIP